MLIELYQPDILELPLVQHTIVQQSTNSVSFYIQLNNVELSLFGLWFNIIRLFKVGWEEISLGGEVVFWWRVGWWRNFLVAR